MDVELLNYTPDALNLLLRTKNTRLNFSEEDPATWTEQRKQEHLDYMLTTIRSSWEFVDYVFRISGVTRAFTHQLVRTRSGSYAQESQRTVDVRDHEVMMPDFNSPSGIPPIDPVITKQYRQTHWREAAEHAMEAYEALILDGVPVQDARGILPTNVTTSIVAKFNLRTLHDMALVRLCTRTQGEYQMVFREMRKKVLAVHPWAEPFIQVHCVATGTCAFPRYGSKDCRYWDPRMDNDQLKAQVRERFWSDDTIQVATPVAKGGMAS